MTTGPTPPAPPEPRKRSGCLLALYIALGIGAVVLVTTVIGILLFVRSERGQKLISLAGEGISLSRDAMQAPGTDELRAAGCSTAMVLPTRRMAELLGALSPEAKEEAEAGLTDDTLVLCQARSSNAAPSCAEVARIYGTAAPDGPERFSVMVQSQSGGDASCKGSYGRDGSLLEPDEPDAAPGRAPEPPAPVEQ